MSKKKFDKVVMNGGYNVELSETMPSEYQCPICMLILRQPVQTLCGHRFCQICLNNLFDQQDEDIICPVDRQDIDMTELFKDKACEREILSIKVKCSNHNSGCNWTGELRDLEGHIGNHCMKGKILCQNENCEMRFLRTDLDDHMKNDCRYRTLKCTYCNDDFVYANQEDHSNSCRRFPLICNNNCGVVEIPRSEMQEHLSECPLNIVACAFVSIGCSAKFQRKLNKEHLEDYYQTHLQLAVTKISEQQNYLSDNQREINTLKSKCEEQEKSLLDDQKEIKALKSKCEEQENSLLDNQREINTLKSKCEQYNSLLLNRTAIASLKRKSEDHENALLLHQKKIRYLESTCEAKSFLLQIVDYREKLESEKISGKAIFSDSYVLQKYQMRLVVYLNGTGSVKGNFMSVFLELMQGEHDDVIEWPFSKTIIFTIIHQDNRSKWYKKQMGCESYSVNGREVKEMQKPISNYNGPYGFDQFIPISTLQNGGFTKNNTLYINCEIAENSAL